jgi:glycosyltransferase involved in cell wall biosynthesis
MKVCIVNPNFYRSSGVTTVIKRMYLGLNNNSVDQYFVNCKYGNHDETNSWIPKDKYLVYNLMSTHPIRLTYELVRFIYWLFKNKIRIVHVYHRRLASILYLFEFLGIYKTIYTAQLAFSFSIIFWLFSPKILVAASLSVRENLLKTTRSKKIHIIGNPCEYVSSYHNLIVDETIKDRAICIARLEPVKGHEFLIDAWKLVINKGYKYKLSLLGEGTLLEELQHKIERLKLSNFVEFVEFTDDISLEIKKCLFTILVSSVEGLPMVIIDAASQGRPTLLNDVDGSRDFLIPGQILPNGLAYGDISSLAETLITWFQNPNDIVKDGTNIFYFCKENYSLDVISKRYIDLYESLN